MNRSDMRAVLASGGTVLHHGKHIRTETELPSEAELALDSGTEASALQAVQAQVARLLVEKEMLERALATKDQTEKKAAAVKLEEEKAAVKK